MEEKPVGYVIASLSHGDFLAERRESGAAALLAYAPNPGDAKRFRDTAKAERWMRRLDRSDLCVCPLFDLGDQWFVEWPEGYP